MSRLASSRQTQEKINYQKEVFALSKQETNKWCADCKQTVSRWTSIKQGIFICVNCSGLHRGIGTDYSRVKSLELDFWDKEMRDIMVGWGNAKANRMFWERHLDERARGRLQKDIKSFIIRKYQDREWVPKDYRGTKENMEKWPDAKDFNERFVELSVDHKEQDDKRRDEDTPLKIRKDELRRESIQRASSKSGQPLPPPPKAKPPLDLFDDVPAPPLRPSTTDNPSIKPPPPQTATAPKPTKTSDSLLGLNDIFGAPPQPATSVRPSSSTSTPSESAASSRIVLKNSILALYSQPPKPQQQTHQQLQPPVGSMQPSSNQAQSNLGGLSNSFNDLSFQSPLSTPVPAPMTQTQPKSDPFASFSTAAAQRSSAAPPKVTPPVLTGQGFFDQKSKSIPKQSAPSKPPTLATPKIDSLLSDDFGSFSSPSNTAPPASNPATNKFSNDLFDFSEPSPPVQAPPPAISTPVPPPKSSSIFNLSKPAPASQAATKLAAAAPSQPTAKNNSSFSNIDAWGSSDAWATPESTAANTAAPQQKPFTSAKPPSIAMSNDFTAWGAPPVASNDQASVLGNGFANGSQAPPKVAPDEDFGGWSSAAPATPAVANPPTQQNKSIGFGEDFGGWNSAAPVTPAVSNAPAQQSKSAGFGEDFGGWNSTAPITPAVKDPPPQPSKPAGGANGFGGGDDLFSNVWE